MVFIHTLVITPLCFNVNFFLEETTGTEEDKTIRDVEVVSVDGDLVIHMVSTSKFVIMVRKFKLL